MKNKLNYSCCVDGSEIAIKSEQIQKSNAAKQVRCKEEMIQHKLDYM